MIKATAHATAMREISTIATMSHTEDPFGSFVGGNTDHGSGVSDVWRDGGEMIVGEPPNAAVAGKGFVGRKSSDGLNDRVGSPEGKSEAATTAKRANEIIYC
jgi:hypothetical protein